MRFDLISIFPELFVPFFEKGMIGQAIKSGKIQASVTNPRDFATDNHRSVDDRPYGGGDGMVMLPEVMSAALESIPKNNRRTVLMSPQGQRLTHRLAEELSSESGLVIVCARYGGIDQRFIQSSVDFEVSIGDFVLCGGEIAAMAMIEATSRFLPGVLGNQESVRSDSFANGLLEAPLYTKPPVFRGLGVPPVLAGGHHKHIAEWRAKVGLLRTYFLRPDLIFGAHAPDLSEALEWYALLSQEDRLLFGLPARNERSET